MPASHYLEALSFAVFHQEHVDYGDCDHDQHSADGVKDESRAFHQRTVDQPLEVAPASVARRLLADKLLLVHLQGIKYIDVKNLKLMLYVIIGV